MYGEAIERSFRIVWRRPYLWLLGVLGGVTAASTGVSSSSPMPRGTSPAPLSMTAFARQLAETVSVPLLVVSGALVLIVLVRSIVGCALQPALIHAAAEHDADRPSDLRSAWHAGLACFWRYLWFSLLTLAIQIIAFVPFLALLGAGLAALLLGSRSNRPAAILLLAFSLPVLAVTIAFLVWFSVLVQLAMRAIALEGRGPLGALWRAEHLFRKLIGPVLLFWVISIGLGLALGLVVGFVTIALGIPGDLMVGIGAAEASQTIVTIGLAISVLVALVTLGIQGLLGTALSVYWTVAFRRLAARLPVPVPAS